MKTAAIIRIVIGSLIALTLTAVLSMKLTGKTHALAWARRADGWEELFEDDDDDADNAEKSAESMHTFAGNGSVPAADVREMEIEWVAGEVRVAPGSGAEVTFTETCGRQLNDNQTMRYSLQNGKLIISYCAKTQQVWDWLDLDRLDMPEKDLTVTVPEAMMAQLQKLEINGVSAGITVSGLTAQKMDVETVSGGAVFSELHAQELDVETVSGEIRVEKSEVDSMEFDGTSGSLAFSGAAQKMDASTVSGDITLAFSNAQPTKVETSVTSGDVTVTLPQDSSFRVRLETVSGELECEFPSVMQDKYSVVGDGTGEYRFESVSGDVRIRKG